MGHQAKQIYEFGPYRLDTGERLLLRDGESVSLTPKSFDLLLALVEHPGHLLEKDELLKNVWPDTFVEETNLTSNISLIRKALGDGENGHKFIETVPKRGYRFVAVVHEIGAKQAELNEATPRQTEVETRPAPLTSVVERRRKGVLLALAVSVIALVGIALGLYKFITRSQGNVRYEPKVIPITSFSGNETQPAFSPDGAQIAFVWDGAQENNPDIYVKLIDAGEPLQLTTNPAPDLNPVWSPDGRYIAFIRQGEGGGIYCVPALGGAEKKLADAFPTRPYNNQSLSFSPDGKFLAYADKSSSAEPFSIFLLSVVDGVRSRMTSPPAGTVGDDSPAFSPDGKLLAFARMLNIGASDIYVAPVVAGGEPKRLTFDNVLSYGLTWTADSREIVFASFRGSYLLHLWRIHATGGTPDRASAFAQGLAQPAISHRGNQLAYTEAFGDTNIWRISISNSARGGDSPTKLIYSTIGDNCPQYSPDGKKIAFLSGRSGSGEIWVCDGDGGNLIKLTNLNNANTGTPRWSPDGRNIVFDSLADGNRDLWVVGLDSGGPRRLTDESTEETVASWSRDARWIYFCSNRSGQSQIWKMPSSGGQAVQVTSAGGYEALESLDGMYLYYTKARRTAGIWRAPVEGGEEKLILDHHGAGNKPFWTVAADGIYFATDEDPRHPLIEFFRFATREVTRIYAMEKPIPAGTRGITVTPDGRWLLFTQIDQSGSDIRLVENFR